MPTSIKRKITAGNLFDCTNLANFIASIIQILPYRGFSMSRFYLCELDGIKFLTKLCFYRKTAIEIYGKTPAAALSHVDAEINILRILNEKFTGRNITPCIIELVYSKVCNTMSKMVPKENVCEHILTEEGDVVPEDDIKQLICRHKDLVKNDLAYDKCAFLVLDKCDMSLDEYLQKSINTPISLAVFKSILFQVIYTFYTITKVYPGFRHYDLHTENIMLKFDPNYKFKVSDPKFLVFTIEGEQYSVPYFGIFPKIIDFGFSSLPEENIVSNAIADKERMYHRTQNDILFLFHWIHFRIRHMANDKLNRIDKLLQQLEPNRSYVQYYTEYIRKIEHKIPTYEQMVKNRVWNEYRQHRAQKNQIYNAYADVNDIAARK
jgi:serine/threonine protein kinase